jgi:hypothetical protein
MMLPFSPEIDREVDRVTDAWITGLAIWRLESTGPGRGICRTCLRYAAELQLDEVPHDVLHLLASALELLVAAHAETDADAPLGDAAVADVLRRRAFARVLPRHRDITWAVEAYVEPQIRRLAEQLMEETCGR